MNVLLFLTLIIDHPFTLPSIPLEKTKSQKFYTDSSFGYDVLTYDINLNVDFPGKNISRAVTTIAAIATQSRSVIKLNFSGMTIDTVKFNGTITTYNRTGSGMDQLLEVDLDTTITNGEMFTISVIYHGTPNEGIYYSTNNGGLTYVMSIPWQTVSMFPVGPRYWFPCNDMLGDKATLTTNITVPENNQVVANGALEKIDTVNTKWTYKWVEHHPIPTWYMVFAISKYAVLRDTFIYKSDTTPVLNFAPHSESANAVIAFQNISQILGFFSDTFGYQYPYYDEKYGFVRVPKPSSGYWLMEYPTNVFYALITPGDNNYEITFAHETAHQWWGGSVTPATVKDIWLNEGFATYSEALYSDFWTGDTFNYHTYMKANIMDYYLAHENDGLTHPCIMYDPPEACLWSATTYEKGGSVLHMLRHVVGDGTFFDLLGTYYATYKHSNASTANFQNLAESVSSTGLNWFFNEWVYKAGHPAYEYAWQCDSINADSFNLYVLVKQVQSHDWDVPTFKMPIDIDVCTSTGDTNRFVLWDSLDAQGFTIPLDSKPLDVAFDPDNWILKTKKLIAVEEKIPQHAFQNTQLSVSRNPFRNHTTINYALPFAIEDLRISIHDVSGRSVKILVSGKKPAGNYTVNFDAKGLSSGIYFVTLSASSGNSHCFKNTGKIILLENN